MDALGHTVMGGEIAIVMLLRWYRQRWFWIAVAVSALFGVLPDLIGAYGNWILHDNWTLYNSAHSGAIYDVLRWYPSYFLHCLIDTAMHGVNAWWVIGTAGFYLEIVLWVANIVILYNIFTEVRNFDE